MKKIIILFCSVCLSCISTSSVSDMETNNVLSNAGSKKIEALYAKLNPEDKSIENVLFALSSYDKANDILKSERAKENDAFKQLEDRVTSITDTVSKKILSAPKAIIKGNEFNSPFSVQYVYASSKNPIKDLPVTITYPADEDRSRGRKISVNTKTNENGIVEFVPKSTKWAQKDEVTFAVSGINSDLSVSLPYVITSNLRTSGGSIALVDYNKDGVTTKNSSISSSKLLALLMKNGFVRIGNSEFLKPVMNDDGEAVQKAAIALFGNSRTTFLIYGTIKYDEISVDSKGISKVVLEGNIRVRHLLNDEEIYRKTITGTGTGASETVAYNAARDRICEQVCDDIVYGL